MNERFLIRGGRQLAGDCTVSGGKNAALAIIPASLLADSPSVIDNLPDINDVHVMIGIARGIGATADFADGVLTIDPRPISSDTPPDDLMRTIRASYYMVPVLLTIFGHAHVSQPGGCAIGARPIDQTLKAFRELGAEAEAQADSIDAVGNAMHAGDIYLDMPSVGATVNAMLLAVSIPGMSYIHNAAKEPHIVDLANFLSSMGASVKGAGTDTIRIRGGRPLHGTNYSVVPDQIETGTLMIAAAATKGDVVIHGAIPAHMESLSAKLLEMGVFIEDEDDRIHVKSNGVFRPVKVKTLGYPGFPTDLQQPLSAMLTVSTGVSMVTETIFENRFRFLDELARMGASACVVENTAIITGVPSLHGARVAATDLRAGVSLVIAGLIAMGETQISGIEYIMRGYEHLDKKLQSLGADITIV